MWSEQVAGMGRERQKNFLEYCQRMIRENFIFNLHQRNLTYMTINEQNFATRFAPFVNERNVMGIMDELSEAQLHIEQNVNAKMVFFDFSLKMIVLLKKMKEDSRVVTITSGTPAVLGFTPDRRQEAGKQFVDVGIAEEHAVALASGIAANGGKPVYGVYSTFIQRSYDQLSQDLCINNNPAVLLVFWGTLSGMNDVTHLCFFDIPLISNIPNMVYLAPTYKEEYLAMLEWSIRQNEHPVAIRVPATDVITCGEPVETDYSVLNRYKVTHRGSKVAILALGSFYGLGQSVASLLKEKANIDATLINPRYITGVDNELMDELKADHELVITLEDGVLDGGFGEKIARYYGATNMKVLNFGAKKEFVDRYDIQEFLRANHLTDEQIVEDITAVIG